MKTLVNTTKGIWAKQIFEAVKYVYGDFNNWGKMRPGCDLVLEREGIGPITITSFGKYINDNVSPADAIAGNVDVDNNICVVCGLEKDAPRYHLQPTDKIYLITS